MAPVRRWAVIQTVSSHSMADLEVLVVSQVERQLNDLSNNSRELSLRCMSETWIQT